MSAHEFAWHIGAPVRSLLTAAIRVYRVLFSGWLGGQCRFYPTCSRYAAEVLARDGALVGNARAAWRILRCAPWTPAGTLDPP